MLRAAAQENKEKTYFTGDPCGRGHVAPRRTLDSLCTECYKLKHLNRVKTPSEVQRGNKLKRMQYWVEQLNELNAEDKAIIGYTVTATPSRVGNTASATAKIILATELMQRARSLHMDTGSIAEKIIRSFDEEDGWWHKMATRPVDEVLNTVLQLMQQDMEEGYFTRGGEYAAEHPMHSSRGTTGHVY